MYSVVAVILVLGLLIFFHELGHFLAARVLKIGVSTFSLGFGPRIFGFGSGRTDYRVAAVPLGGYVQLVGESVDAELPEGFTEKDSFSLRPVWQRIMVVGAGPAFNFLLAFLIYWGVFLAQGQMHLMPQVGEVDPDLPAHEAGLKSGDVVTAVNGHKIEYWEDLATRIKDSEGSRLVLTVQREGDIRRIKVIPEMIERKNIFGETKEVPQIGVAASGETVYSSLTPAGSLVAAGQQTWRLTVLTVKGIVKLIERVIPLDNIGGPIMIAQVVSQQAEEGLVNLLGITALISINLGLLNLLPIPVLDGGHIVFFAIEGILRRPLDERLQAAATKIGLALLVALMGLAIFNDLWRSFG
ncbi:MAG: RIP metalloprotease RseP [Desulfonatronovibrionaceae bacterium]